MRHANCLHDETESCVFCSGERVTKIREVVAGVGPDAPIIADSTGYRSSESPYRMDLMPGAALLHMSKIMCEGAKTHGENNWKNGTVEKHLNKALVHLFAHLAGDSSDDHLGHAAWRTMAALEIHLGGSHERGSLP